MANYNQSQKKDIERVLRISEISDDEIKVITDKLFNRRSCRHGFADAKNGKQCALNLKGKCKFDHEEVKCSDCESTTRKGTRCQDCHAANTTCRANLDCTNDSCRFMHDNDFPHLVGDDGCSDGDDVGEQTIVSNWTHGGAPDDGCSDSDDGSDGDDGSCECLCKAGSDGEEYHSDDVSDQEV